MPTPPRARKGSCGGSPIVSGTRYSRGVTVDIRSNEADAVLTATRNGQSFTSGTTITENGAHTISAAARDSFGHTSPVSEVTFTIDRDGPVVTIAEPQSKAYPLWCLPVRR